MTLSILASVVVVTTLPISYFFVKSLGSIYTAKALKYDKMLRESNF